MSSKESQIEAPSRIEPTRLPQVPEQIADLVAELSSKSSALGHRLHPKTASNLAQLVRVMNCYYSNLIEGHNTRPKDIERALQGDFNDDVDRKNLQMEAAAHVRVQAEVDRLAVAGELLEPASNEFLLWLHREFYKDAPKETLTVKSQSRSFEMTAGAWRASPEHDVVVGRHIPPSSSRVSAFMSYFEQQFTLETAGPAAKIIAIPISHHRFNYIHPFPDGNGRVSRLMSHAMTWRAGIAAHALWSVSRGLARGIESRSEYKAQMDNADSPRQGDLDGRGNLSLKSLVEFVDWFLRVCLDQITFMQSLFDLEDLSRRLERLVSTDRKLKPEAYSLLRESFLRGQIERGEASRITGLPERSARRVLNELVSHGLLASDSPKTPVSLRFPADYLEVLFPKLYPET